MIYELIALALLCVFGAGVWFVWRAPVLTQAERLNRIAAVGPGLLIALLLWGLGNERFAVVCALVAVFINGVEMLRLRRKLRLLRGGGGPLTAAEVAQERSEDAALRAAALVGAVAVESTSTASGGGVRVLHLLRDALGSYLFSPAEEEMPGGRAKGQTRFGYACIGVGKALGRSIRRLRGDRSWMKDDEPPKP